MRFGSAPTHWPLMKISLVISQGTVPNLHPTGTSGNGSASRRRTSLHEPLIQTVAHDVMKQQRAVLNIRNKKGTFMKQLPKQPVPVPYLGLPT